MCCGNLPISSPLLTVAKLLPLAIIFPWFTPERACNQIRPDQHKVREWIIRYKEESINDQTIPLK